MSTQEWRDGPILVRGQRLRDIETEDELALVKIPQEKLPAM